MVLKSWQMQGMDGEKVLKIQVVLVLVNKPKEF